ncbi:translation initiation factor IF-2-like, partial [Corvus hawaiiensis]|uniref:translation initiation factor IF-2-like n=1 Tax=Corvus hawaiiensis TaxID=134902 RepID=UPI0020192B55
PVAALQVPPAPVAALQVPPVTPHSPRSAGGRPAGDRAVAAHGGPALPAGAAALPIPPGRGGAAAHRHLEVQILLPLPPRRRRGTPGAHPATPGTRPRRRPAPAPTRLAPCASWPPSRADVVTLGDFYRGRAVTIQGGAELSLGPAAWGDSGLYVCTVTSTSDLQGNNEAVAELVVLGSLPEGSRLLPEGTLPVYLAGESGDLGGAPSAPPPPPALALQLLGSSQSSQVPAAEGEQQPRPLAAPPPPQRPAVPGGAPGPPRERAGPGGQNDALSRESLVV